MIKKIAPDKWRHFYAGILLGVVFQGIALLVFEQFVAATLVCFILVVAISYGFELFSKWTGMGHYDVMDAVASVIGGIVGMAIVIITMQFW